MRPKKKINRDIESKKNQFNSEIENEIVGAEKEIHNLKLSSTENINKIAAELSSAIIKKIIGNEINASSVSAIVNDVSKKEVKKYL